MKKKMIYRFPTPFIHAIPIHNYNFSLSQVIQKLKIFPRAAVHTKKLTLDGTLTLQMVFQGNDELDGMDNV
jgi:hypothetical protein